jgi:putative endopeptidase
MTSFPALHTLARAAFLAAALMAAGPPNALAATTDSEEHGIDLAGMDRALKPGDDFFRYANGTWVKDTPIPADRAGFGVSETLTELTDRRVADLIRDAGRTAAAGSDARKAADYYATFMDEQTIEKLGLKPLEGELARIAAIKDRIELARALGSTLRADVDALNNTNIDTDHVLGVWIAQSLDDPSRYVPFLLQGGLGMPDRTYYLDSSKEMIATRAQYRSHIARLLDLAHISDAQSKAAAIVGLEQKIAQAHASRVDSEDVAKADNHWARRDFAQRAPGLDWMAFLTAAGLQSQNDFIVWHPSAVTGLATLVAAQPLETWKAYLTFHALEHAAPYLPQAFVAERFAFNGKVLAGTPELRVRWKRAVSETNDALGEAVGKLYVDRYFPPAEKARAQAMVRALIEAFARRIDGLAWMAPETRARAKAKLAALKVGVGYPDHWRSYSALEVVRGDALGNAERAELFEYHRNLAKLGQPVDRGEWVMTPQTVNAVNLPVMNALNFPAATLQPPYFDPNRALVIDYGAAGATMGHEISHSFDDQGALFDASGKLHNWWQKEDFAHFRAEGARLAHQFDRYRPFPDLAVNGQQTLSENIADVAGLAVAYDAYRLTLHGTPAAITDGFSGDQQFFLGYAQSWREKQREPALRNQLITDGHAPEEYRADTVRNLDAWYPAFKVQPGQRLFLAPADRVPVW